MGTPVPAACLRRIVPVSVGTSSPASSDRTRRRSASNGASRLGFRPMVSTALSPSPAPRITRPGHASCSVAKALATTAGSRVTRFVTLVPSTTRPVAAAAAARVT